MKRPNMEYPINASGELGTIDYGSSAWIEKGLTLISKASGGECGIARETISTSNINVKMDVWCSR